MEQILLLFGILAYTASYYAVVKLAHKKGYNYVTWLLLSMAITPILGTLILLLKRDSEAKRTGKEAGRATSQVIKESMGQSGIVKVRCSSCEAAVDESARFCPECGAELEIASG